MKRKKITNPNTNLNYLRREDLVDFIRKEISQGVPHAVRRIAVEKTEIFSGPIPPPGACKQYEEILPGFTNRAVTIAEKAQLADIKSRSRADHYLLIWRILSVTLAALLAALILGGGIYLLSKDKNIAGFSVLLAGVCSLVGLIMSKKG